MQCSAWLPVCVCVALVGPEVEKIKAPAVDWIGNWLYTDLLRKQIGERCEFEAPEMCYIVNRS